MNSLPDASSLDLAVSKEGPHRLPVRHRKGRVEKSTSTSDLYDACLDANNSCIWNSTELDVLRKVFHTARDKNRFLQAELEETKHHLIKLRDANAKLSLQTKTVEEQLSSAVKANDRLKILSENLKKKNASLNSKVVLLQREVQHSYTLHRECLQEVHQLRVSFDQERLDRKKAELQLQAQNREALREQKLVEEKVEFLHQGDIEFLQKQIKELKKSLAEEKEHHKRTKRGLSKLQQHFASLPLAESQASGVVTKSQLKRLDF